MVAHMGIFRGHPNLFLVSGGNKKATNMHNKHGLVLHNKGYDDPHEFSF
jgi:hypothetical protein